MKTGYDVFWSEIAEADLLVIIEYITNEDILLRRLVDLKL
jgi:hypothetical protein